MRGGDDDGKKAEILPIGNNDDHDDHDNDIDNLDDHADDKDNDNG